MEEEEFANVKDELENAKKGDTILHLNYKGLKNLPPCLLSDICYRNLKTIYAKRNLLIRLPENLNQLSSLVELYLPSNNIKVIPDGICCLKKLESLNLCDNELTRLPADIGHLRNLQKLQVSVNKLSSLPLSIGDLCNLKTLELMRNDLSILPVSLCRCEKLVTLNLDYNRLTGLPRQFWRLTNLSEISVCGNNLINLPQTFASKGVSKLRCLLVDKNPALHILPLSLIHIDTGNFQSCRRSDPLGVLPGVVELVVPYKEILVPIVMPPEIRNITAPWDSVPSLQELGLRATGVLRSRFSDLKDFRALLDSLPCTLKSLLLDPTAFCQSCHQEVYVTALPIVVLDQPVFYLGFCCSIKCAVQISLMYSTNFGMDIAYPLCMPVI
ncbi:leucine-rich repeat-containing protein 28-like [Pecten maximus]|uniref:leucine-rich repeat-containing protein 28-like n=1 Tax=Pecten maximus TaxID=6579 RepID=UPI001458781A|nr:leucine-rich repeat-containing protein 28-like [Pecten maximus]XP_033750786.1 leucine-rich repeat-containing protein 28-like [Pecten maximus]XP_033750787.1 leucine-rich repeat-containing protein 28-like [Pecten maximus]